MKSVCVMESISRANGGIFEAELDLQKTLQVKFNVGVQVVGLEDAHTQADLGRWSPLTPTPCRIVGPRALGYSPALAAGLRNIDADLGYVAGLWKYPSFAAQHWAESRRRPLIVAPHGMLDPWALQNSAWKKRLAARLFQDRQLQRAACIRALCDAEAQSIRACGYRAPIAIVPNGVDLPTLGERRSRPSFFPADRRVLFYLGRLHRKKGLRALVQAWSQVQPRHPEWLLVIAGWDQEDHARELQHAATAANLEWTNGTAEPGAGVALCLPGPQFGAVKADCLSHCDALVLPSQSEGLPMVVLEAWSYAKPVLMTPACHLPEGARAGAAMMAEPSAASLTSALEMIFASAPAELEAMGARGRALVEDSFQWPAVASRLVAVYEWVLGAGSIPACVI
jgi:poly(glycerol-phosphate) alpha-glucosyltransferase